MKYFVRPHPCPDTRADVLPYVEGQTPPEGFQIMTQEELDAIPPPEVTAMELPPPVPESVSLKQFRKALRRRGVSPESVVAWINANVTDPIERAEAIEDIEYSNVVERANPFLNAMAAALGKDPAWVDDTMRLAASLQ